MGRRNLYHSDRGCQQGECGRVGVYTGGHLGFTELKTRLRRWLVDGLLMTNADAKVFGRVS